MTHIDYKGYSCWSDIGNMTPEQYIHMINLLEEYKPKRICELGSGQSTEIFETYAKQYNAEIYSIEHDIFYRTHKSNIMMQLLENIKFQIKDKIYLNCDIYNGLENWLRNQKKFDFILIDGPNDVVPSNNRNLHYSRIQLLSFLLLNKLTNNSIILYHDSNVIEAENTLKEFECELNLLNINYDKQVIKENNKEIIDYNNKFLNMCPELTIYKLNN